MQNGSTFWSGPILGAEKLIWCNITSKVSTRETFYSSGDRGGVPNQKIFFFVWTYFVAPVMGEQELNTESKNIRRLPRYGLRFYIGKCPISVFQNNLQFLSTFSVLDLETPFFGFEKVSGCQKILWERIFEKVIFWPVWGHFRAKNGVFQIFAPKMALSWPKNDFFKNRLP